MRKYYLYGHDGSANHGCEALVRSTAELLDYKKNKIILVSKSPEEDNAYHLSNYCKIIKKGEKANQIIKDRNFMRAYYALKIKHDYSQMDLLPEVQALGMSRNDVAFAIGGDSYCYSNYMRSELFHQHDLFKFQGIKTVLWGCSFEEELLKDRTIVNDLKSFNLITARESITYKMLRSINPNTILVADSAFLLNEKRLAMPNGFDRDDIVGINTSPLIERRESVPGIARKNIEKLIEAILDETEFKILLIPHVVWKNNDDLSVLDKLHEKYMGSGRVALIKDHNCEELKGFISRCRFFIGARTHATIAAYSSGIPTLVLGYSTKSKGIAYDLFGSYENYVVPVQTMESDLELTNKWRWLQYNEAHIREKLIQVLPEYVRRVSASMDLVRKM